MKLKTIYNILSLFSYQVTIKYKSNFKEKFCSDVFPYVRDGRLYYNIYDTTDGTWGTTSCSLSAIKSIKIK